MRAPIAFVLGWTVLLALAGCGGGAERESRESPREPAQVFLAGDGRLTVVDVDAGRARVHAIPELAPGDPLYRIVRRGSKLVLFGFDTYVVDVDLSSPPRKLGDSWFFIPGAEPDRVWLSQLDPTSPETERALAAVREMSVTGRVTVPAVRPPGGRWPLAAVGDTLVLEDRSGGLELWSPETGQLARRIPDALLGTAQGDLLAWCERGAGDLHVADVESGRDRTIEPPPGHAGFDCGSGAFSPDGTLLAVAALAEEGWEAERTLTIVDLEEDEASAVPESSVHPHYGFVAWSSAGDRVFMSGGAAHERRLLQYLLGDEAAVEIPVEVGDFYGMAAN